VSARPEVLALALIRHPDGDRILVSRGGGFDRLLGGKVEHLELTHEAVRRELDEEIGLGVSVRTEPRQVLQMIFDYRGERHHQIGFVHDAVLDNPDDHDRDTFTRMDRDDSIAVWRSLSVPPPEPLYPDGLDLS
jgi:8-oxo-dGTP pyrophosphatase MutT (NUDIX family)